MLFSYHFIDRSRLDVAATGPLCEHGGRSAETRLNKSLKSRSE